MAAIVAIDSGRGISIHARHGNLPGKSKLVLHKPLLHRKNKKKQLQLSNKEERFNYKGGCG